MSKKSRKQRRQHPTRKPPPATAPPVAPPQPTIPDDLRQKVSTWILEGVPDLFIREAIAKDNPDQDATAVIRLALDHIVGNATSPAVPIDKWCTEAAKLIYQRQVSLGQFADALQTVKRIDELAQRQIKAVSCVSSPPASSTNPPGPTTELIDPNHQSRDARLINRALKSGWDIPETIKHTLPLEMANILSTATSNSDKISAARVLVTMQAQNIRAKPPVKRHRHEHKLDPTPITEQNFEERRRQLSARIAGRSEDTGGPRED